MRRLHWILSGLSLTIVLLSLNRLTSVTAGRLQPHEFLRWVDVNAMLTIPLLSIVLYFLLKREIVYDSAFRRTGTFAALSALFVAGVYLFGAGSGVHEVTNYLNARFCDAGRVTSPECAIIAYNDDGFSHYVYYAGFIAINVALVLMERAMPRMQPASRRDLLLIACNSLVIALGVFAFEEIGLDLAFFGFVALVTHASLLRAGPSRAQLPVTLYFAVAYTLGIAATIAYKAAAP